jgi:hypothetical protein
MNATQFYVAFDHLFRPSRAKTRQYAQYHLTAHDIGVILGEWDTIAPTWEPVVANFTGTARQLAGRRNAYHPTTITRAAAPRPIRDYLASLSPDQLAARRDMRVLYHGVGRDAAGAELLGACATFDPYHPDPEVRRPPAGKFDEIISCYTLNVVDQKVGKAILEEILGLLAFGGRAIITVRRDLR